MSRLLFIAVLFALVSCGSEGADNTRDDSSREDLSTTVTTTPSTAQTPSNVTPTDPPPAPVNIPAGPDGKVWHYVCADNCKGGTGDGAGPCPVCAKPMAHNQAFHNTTGAGATSATSTTSPTITPSFPGGSAGTTITPPAPKAEPAQNAAGVWHYTCTDGCAGGAGSAVACAKCGKTLVHNTAYHN